MTFLPIFIHVTQPVSCLGVFEKEKFMPRNPFQVFFKIEALLKLYILNFI